MPLRIRRSSAADVIAVAREGEQTIPQVARSFGISESCLHRWLRVAEQEEKAGQDPPPGGEQDLIAEKTRRDDGPRPWPVQALLPTGRVGRVERVLRRRGWGSRECLQRRGRQSAP